MKTPSDGACLYRFADLTLDVARRAVCREGQPIELKALDFDLLRFLVDSAPSVVNADLLAEEVWGRHFVSPENVAQRVMLLRQSLGDDATRPRYIATVRNRGYRLVPAVERSAAKAPESLAPTGGRARLLAIALLSIAVIAAATYWLRPADEPPAYPSSVAVLPFENSSPDPKDAYFAAGIRDEVVAQLTKISGLRVFPVTPAAGAHDVLPGVNAATVLKGSVYYSDERVRVTLRLTDSASGISLWSDSYERELGNIFALQSDIALDVARALSLELSAADRHRIERLPTVDPRARDLYLRARARHARETADEMLSAIDELERAVAHDSAFAEAWVTLANVRTTAQYLDPQRSREHQARAEQAARRAAELDAQGGGAHSALGYALSTVRDWRGAEAAYREARRRNASLAEVGPYAILQLSVGNFGFARAILEERRSAQPEDPTTHRFLMFANAALGDWGAATELYESGLQLFMPWRQGPTLWTHWLVGRGDLAEALTIPAGSALSAAMLGNLESPTAALAELRRAHESSGPGDSNARRDIALWAGHFGDPVLALEAMRAAVDEQGGQMVYVWLPQLKAMRELPAFKDFLRDVGMVDYWQEYGWQSVCQRLGPNDFDCN